MADAVFSRLVGKMDDNTNAMKEMMEEKFRLFEEQTKDQLNNIENLIVAKEEDSGNFTRALKTEVEALSDLNRRQNFENLTIMKNLTGTMKNLKDNYKYFREHDVQMRQMLSQLVEYFNYVNKIIGTKGEQERDIISQSVHVRNSAAHLNVVQDDASPPIQNDIGF